MPDRENGAAKNFVFARGIRQSSPDCENKVHPTSAHRPATRFSHLERSVAEAANL